MVVAYEEDSWAADRSPRFVWRGSCPQRGGRTLVGFETRYVLLFGCVVDSSFLRNSMCYCENVAETGK